MSGPLGGAWRHWRLVLARYVLATAAALPVAAAIGRSVHRHAGKSLAGESLAQLEPLAVLAFLDAQGPAVGASIGAFAAIAILWLVASTALAAATYGAVGAPAPVRVPDLFAASGRHFWRLVRLSMMTVPFTTLAVGLPVAAVFRVYGRLSEGAVDEEAMVLGRIGATLFALVLLGAVNAACDLMKAHAAGADEARAHRAFWRGLVQAVRRPGPLFGVYVPLAGGAVAVTILASLVDARIARASPALVAAGIALQQLTALARAYLAVALAHAEVGLVRVDRT